MYYLIINSTRQKIIIYYINLDYIDVIRRSKKSVVEICRGKMSNLNCIVFFNIVQFKITLLVKFYLTENQKLLFETLMLLFNKIYYH